MDAQILYQTNRAELQRPDERWTTMSITSPGKCTLEDQKRSPKPYVVKATNFVGDIDGAITKSRYDHLVTKITNQTIPDAFARPKHHARNVQDLSLHVDDIDGARFAPTGGMERTKRKMDPLNPKYILPSFASPLPIMIDSAKDPLYVGDIDGTKSKAFSTYSTRDPISASDIPGATANYKERAKLALLANTFGSDLQRTVRVDFSPEEMRRLRFQDRSSRCIDIMAPSYQYNGMVIADDPLKSKPKKLPQYVPNGTFSLLTEDIEGATPGKLKEKKFTRRELRNIMSTADIVGAQADTVLHAIVSTRNTCPLSPTYQSLNYGEPLEPIIKPLIDSTTAVTFGPASLRFLKKGGAQPLLSQLASPISSSRRPSGGSFSPASPSPSPLPPLSSGRIEKSRQEEIAAVRELGAKW